MAGHSHWAGIKHKKGLMDAKRGKIFSKLSKDIMLAVREGGPDPGTNIRLRYAIDKARENNMPKANIERAIKKMSGDGNGQNFVDLIYEGYGPGGIAIIAEVLTDNRNRTASELRKLFESSGGKMGETGCVSYLFSRKGLFTIALSAMEEEKIMDIALEAGAENLEVTEDCYEITTNPSDFHQVKSSLEAQGLTLDIAEVTYIPQNTVTLAEENARKALAMIQKMEDHDDVQNVSSNYDIPDEIMAKIEEESS